MLQMHLYLAQFSNVGINVVKSVRAPNTGSVDVNGVEIDECSDLVALIRVSEFGSLLQILPRT